MKDLCKFCQRFCLISVVVALLNADIATAQTTTNHTRLRIAVPPRHGFTEFVKIDQDPDTGNLSFSGFAIEVFNHAVSLSLGKSILFDFIPFANSDGTMKGTYLDMVKAVFHEEYDGVVGDLTIRFDRAQLVDFTTPYIAPGISMLIPTHKTSIRKLGKSLMVMTKGLVIAALIFFFLSAAVFLVVAWANRNKRSPKNVDQWGREMMGTARSTRMALVLWSVVLLFLITCYSTTLISLLTEHSPGAPNKTLDEVRISGEKVGFMKGSFVYDLLKNHGLHDNRLVSYHSQKELEAFMSQGHITVAVDETPYLSVFVAQHCDAYAVVPIPSLHSSGYGFAFRKGTQLAQNISRGIIKMIDSGQLGRIQARTIGGSGICDVDPNYDADSNFVFVDTFVYRTLFAGAITAAILVSIIYYIYFRTMPNINLNN